MNKTIIWFRQDLRIHDNTAFIKALESCDEILPIFIFDTNIVGSFGGLEDKKFLFLKEALLNLDSELRELDLELKIFHDNPVSVFEKISSQNNITAIYANRSYSVYGKKRDDSVELLSQSKGIDFELFSDYLMIEPDAVEQRKVFTPFYKLWQKQLVLTDISVKNYQHITDMPKLLVLEDSISARDFLEKNIEGEKHPYFTLELGQNRLEQFSFSHYDEYRNALDKDGTSRLSVYTRFGIFSVREIYHRVKDLSESYVSELAWREFWQHIDYCFPFTKEYAFQEKKRYIEWEYDEFSFQRWCEGKTGYPIVDAAMKQLVETNWMHGRARMIVASFLTKDLLIDWKHGEKFFKKHLLDYDENVNFGNWQWSASVGADPKPLRIFSPILQSQKFDPNGDFIFKYLPELKGQDLKAIHNPLKYDLDYIPLIVDHAEAQRKAREVYKNSAIKSDEKNGIEYK